MKRMTEGSWLLAIMRSFVFRSRGWLWLSSPHIDMFSRAAVCVCVASLADSFGQDQMASPIRVYPFLLLQQQQYSICIPESNFARSEHFMGPFLQFLPAYIKKSMRYYSVPSQQSFSHFILFFLNIIVKKKLLFVGLCEPH